MERVLELPCWLRSHDGGVSVFYGVNKDPEYWGFDLLDLPFDRALVCGFPLMLATIADATDPSPTRAPPFLKNRDRDVSTVAAVQKRPVSLRRHPCASSSPRRLARVTGGRSSR